MSIPHRTSGLLALFLAVALALGACTGSAPSVASGSELPPEVTGLVTTFYQGASAEAGEDFNLDQVRSVTAEPLQTHVVIDLQETAQAKAPEAYYLYRDVQILGGGCTGQGSDRVCEVRVQRAYDSTDQAGTPQGARNDTRVFRAKQVDGEWKLVDTQINGAWIEDFESGNVTPPATN